MKMCKRGVIYPTMLCNLRCTFCYYRFLKKEKHRSFEDVRKELDKLKFYYNLEAVDITGGEPTVYPDIVKMVKYCSEINLKPTIITNAQRTNIFPKLIENGLDDLLISIHGYKPDHDKGVAKKGAYDQIMKTIKVLKEYDFKFRVNCTMTKFNYKNLPKYAKAMIKIEPRKINFICFNPHEGTDWAKINTVKFQAKYSEITPFLQKAIDILDASGIWVNVRYFPLCMMRGYEKHVCNFHQWQYDPYEWEYKSGFKLTKEQISELTKIARMTSFGKTDEEKLLNYLVSWSTKNNLFLPTCQKCRNYEICYGIYPQYLRRFGGKEFIPVPGKRIKDPIYYRRKDLRWRE